MTWTLRRLHAGEIDHELLWAGVAAGAGVVGIAMLLAGAMPVLGCPFKTLTGLPCVTCGATRMAVAFLHGQLAAGVRFNPMLGVAVLASLPLTGYAWAAVLLRTRRLRVTVSPTGATLVRAAAWLALAANWAFLIVDGR